MTTAKETRLPPVLLGKEGHRLPRLMRSFLSTCLLRMDAKEGAGKGLDSVGNNEQMEDAVLGLMAAVLLLRPQGLLPATRGR